MAARFLRRTSSSSATRSSSRRPRVRWGHCAANVGGKVVLRGGGAKDITALPHVNDLRLTVHTFDPLEEVWAGSRATGEPHPGVVDGACVAVAKELFYYGGLDHNVQYQGVLSRFTPAANNWAALSKNSPDGPMSKFGCGMVSCGEGKLCVFAGHGIPTGPVQPGSRFIKNPLYADGRGWTNEVHIYDINGSVWSSPALTGTRPCPRLAFTLTAINDHQAIGFGGYSPEQGKLNDTFMVDFKKMEWSQLDIKGELPVPRDGHTACCLNFGDDRPMLLVTGGVDSRNKKVLDDVWILDIQSKIWRKVDLPSGSLPRAYHSLTAITLGERVTEVVSFGGYCKVPKTVKNDANVDPIDETTVMRFESRPSPPSADSPSQWTLTDVANSRQLGSKERVTAKKELVAKLCMKHHHTTATLQPQATSSSDESHTLRETQRALQDSLEREQVLEQRAQEAERRLQAAEELTHQLQQFADASERREQKVNERAEEATARTQQLETRAQVAEEATARVQMQLQEQTTRTQDAERNAEDYHRQAEEAEALKQQYERQAAAAETRVEQLEQAVEEANRTQESLTKQYNTQTTSTEIEHSFEESIARERHYQRPLQESITAFQVQNQEVVAGALKKTPQVTCSVRPVYYYEQAPVQIHTQVQKLETTEDHETQTKKAIAIARDSQYITERAIRQAQDACTEAVELESQIREYEESIQLCIKQENETDSIILQMQQTLEEAAKAKNITDSEVKLQFVKDSNTQRAPEVQYSKKEESAQRKTQISQGFLRGVDVLAETEFTYTGTAESFEWKGHGFRLHFPENALPPNVSACVVSIKAAISGQFEIPQDTELVSGIYCIYCPHKFINAVTLEVQHCSEVASSDDGAQLSFVTAKCTQPNLPYHFRYCKDGVFSEHTTFASVQLTHFSMYGAVRKGRQHCRKNYCSQIYYTERSTASTKVEFIITQNLKLHIKAIKKKFFGAVPGPCQELVFTEDEIKLNIPQEGVKVGEGGSIIPLSHPGIRKDQVDCFRPGTMVPSCELLIKRPSGSEIEVYRAKLIGAEEPNTFFTIECYPISVPFKIPKPTASQKPVELDVKTAISNVIKWFELGEQLEIEFSALEAILRDYAQYGTEFQRSKMVNTWLKSDPEASWSKLCGALERMGERTLAQDIKRQYIESD